MKKSISTLLLVGAMASGTAFADTAYTPPPIGAQVVWPSRDAGTSSRLSEVVATGDDFAIYAYDLDNGDTNPFSYFAEFSGLHVVSCGVDMPSAGDRERLVNLWPFQQGRSVEVGEDYKVTYQVGGRRVHTLTQIAGPQAVQDINVFEDGAKTRKSISLEHNTMVIDTDLDGHEHQAREVFVAQGAGAELRPETLNLGKCARLIREEDTQNYND